MSRTSDKKGHKCNKPKCRGFCSTKKVWHAGQQTRRKRVCRICGTIIYTCEFNVSWEFSMFDDTGPVKKSRAVKVPAAK